jgi:hypothetical protein
MSKEKEYLIFQVRRKVTNLFKNFLFLLEDLDKDIDNIPPEKYKQVRKRVLDYSNDALREIEEDLNKFNITL